MLGACCPSGGCPWWPGHPVSPGGSTVSHVQPTGSLSLHLPRRQAAGSPSPRGRSGEPSLLPGLPPCAQLCSPPVSASSPLTLGFLPVLFPDVSPPPTPSFPIPVFVAPSEKPGCHLPCEGGPGRSVTAGSGRAQGLAGRPILAEGGSPAAWGAEARPRARVRPLREKLAGSPGLGGWPLGVRGRAACSGAAGRPGGHREPLSWAPGGRAPEGWRHAPLRRQRPLPTRSPPGPPALGLLSQLPVAPVEKLRAAGLLGRKGVCLLRGQPARA